MKKLLLSIIIILLLSSTITHADYPPQTYTITHVVNGEIYCYCYDYESTMSWYRFGTTEQYHLTIEDGFYIFQWSGDVNADDQAIINILSLSL